MIVRALRREDGLPITLLIFEETPTKWRIRNPYRPVYQWLTKADFEDVRILTP